MKLRTYPPALPVQMRTDVPSGPLQLEDGRLLLPYTHPRTPQVVAETGHEMFWWTTEPELRLVSAAQERAGFSNSEWKRLLNSLFVSADAVDWGDGFGPLLHVCVSYPDRIPPWEDVRQVRYAFYPRDIDVMMLLPRDGMYINRMEFCMQMYQCPTIWM